MPAANWIGEPEPDMPMKLLELVREFHPRCATEVTQGLWRRHNSAAYTIVARWEDQPQEAKLIFEGLNFTIGELSYIANNEHVISEEDLLRRRTPIALVRSKVEIQQHSQLQDLLNLI